MKRTRFLIAALVSTIAALSAGAVATDAKVGAIKQFNLPAPQGLTGAITAGPDGNVYFGHTFACGCIPPSNYDIGRLTPGGTLTTYSVPTPTNGCQCAGIAGITAGPDGNVWFTEADNDKVSNITPAGVITEYTPPPVSGPNGPLNVQPAGIATGPDGNLWFVDTANDAIDVVTTAGQFTTSYSLPSTNACVQVGACVNPAALIAGPHGTMWFTTTQLVGRITATGAVSEFTVPGFTNGIGSITSGPDGNVWFTLSGNNASYAVRITPTGSEKLFKLPARQVGGAAIAIASGHDGNLWITVESNAAPAIDRLTLAGQWSIFLVPDIGAEPNGITAGPASDRATMWAVDPPGNDIDVISTR